MIGNLSRWKIIEEKNVRNHDFGKFARKISNKRILNSDADTKNDQRQFFQHDEHFAKKKIRE